MILMSLGSTAVLGQQIKGQVITINNKGVSEGIPGAKVKLKNSGEIVLSNVEGYF